MTVQHTTLAEDLAAIIAGGPATCGVAVRQIERNERVDHAGGEVFPTASVFKIPVLVEAFRRVAAGDLALSDRWELTDEDKSTGSGVLVRLDAGLRPTVHDLLTLMIIISDNTATDMLVRRLGPERITATMRALGLHRTVVAHTCIELIRGIAGDAAPGLLPHEMAAHMREHPPAPDSFAYACADDNNVTTPWEMADLLAGIHTGDGLSALGIQPLHRAEMRAILLRQQLNDRMPRFLPGSLPLAHKTGSLSGPWAIRNDAGLIDLGTAGTIAMTVFTRTRMPDGADPRELNRLLTDIDMEIAALTRTVVDHFMS